MTGHRHRHYEWVADGCPTDGERCNHTDPVTAYQLDGKGRRRFSLTVCVERSDLR